MHDAGFAWYRDTSFAGRAAPLGLATAEVVDALFSNVAPGEVARHIPKVWRTTTPESAIAARQMGCAKVLRRTGRTRAVTVCRGEMLLIVVSFETFAGEHGPRLRAGLVSAYGPDVGLDAAAEAMAYGFEHWHRLSEMGNPSGYLYRVGQTAARRSRRPGPALPAPEPSTMPMIEPGLAPALNDLSELQRTCVLLVHAFGWTRVEAALLLGIDESSVRTHIRRGMSKLQGALEENRDVTRS